MRTIQYAVAMDTGLVVSRVGSELAWPILDYDKMLPENNYRMDYYLEKMPIFSVETYMLKWRGKIPRELKNKHREFWGFPLLK